MTRVIIRQLAQNLDLLAPTNPSWSSLLSQVVAGFAKPFASATAVTLDVDGSNFDILVAGTGLTYNSWGQLVGGTITSISVLSSSGLVLADLANAEPGGIAIDVAGLRAARGSPDLLDALVSHWAIEFSAATLPTSGMAVDTGASFEGARGTDFLTGSAFGDELRGAGGGDTILGGTGDDNLFGDASAFVPLVPSGHDTLFGGEGNDYLQGDGGNDRLYGGEGADTLRGDHPDHLGHDLMDGGAGNDWMFAEIGDDTYVGGTGRDKLSLLDHLGVSVFIVNLATGVATGLGSDRVSSIEIVEGSYESSNLLTGSTAAEAFSGSWHTDTLSGGGGNDRLWGDWGNDRLNGGSGNDLLGGSAGADTVYGGTGLDAFYFAEADGDRVEDLVAVDDQIWIASGIAGLGGSGLIATSAFKNLDRGSADSNDRVLYRPSTGELFIDANGSVSGGRALLARLDAGTALSANDIEIRPLWDRDDFMI